MFILFSLFVSCLLIIHSNSTALDDYVNKPDANYGWVEMEELKWSGTGFLKREIGYSCYVLNMTSQQWLTPSDFAVSSESGSIWWHYLTIIVPDNLKHKVP